MNGDLAKQLMALEYEAEHAQVGDGAGYLNQAGDLCLRAQFPVRALEYYGLAIDAHVKADRFTPAMALCRKVLRVAPVVVRARCTLAWLAIGSGFEADACELVDNYVGAASRAGHERLALAQLRWMGDVAAAESLRLMLGERLLELGDDRSSDHVFGMAFAERNGVRRATPPGYDERWITARRAALLNPREIAA